MTTRLNPAFLFYLGYGLLLALCLYFFVGCATYKATLPDGTILENCAMKELTTPDAKGRPIVQRVVFPVQNKDVTNLINSLNNILLPWLASDSPPVPQVQGTYTFTPAK